MNKFTLIDIGVKAFEDYLKAIDDLADHLNITTDEAEDMIAGEWIENLTGHRDEQSKPQ